MERSYARPAGHWDFPIHVSHKPGVRSGEMIFVGGQVDLDPRGNVRNPGDLETQTRNVMENIQSVLAEFGAGLEDVVKLVAFYVNDGSLDEAAFLGDVGAAFGKGPGPAVTAVPVAVLGYPEMVVEIEAVAMLGEDGARLPKTRAAANGHSPLPEPFVHGVSCGEMIFVAGQAGRDASGRVLHGHDIVRQSEVVMDNLERVLAELGAGFDDVVKMNRYYVGRGRQADWEPAAKIVAARFAEPGPAATGIPLPRLWPDGEMVRVEAVAMRGEDGSRLPRRHVWPEGHWDWPIHLPYKHGLKCGDMIFVGGQVALTPEGTVIDPGDVEAQARTSLENIRRVLNEFGATVDDVVKVNAFYKGIGTAEDLHRNLTIRSAAFTEPGPATTGIPLPCLAYEDLMIEIEVVAMAPWGVPLGP